MERKVGVVQSRVRRIINPETEGTGRNPFADIAYIIRSKWAILVLTCCLFCNISLGATHVVVRGDSLWKIACRYYGNGNRWTDIHTANMSLINNPHRIRPGQRLRIPDGKSRVPHGYRYWKTVRAKVTAYTPHRNCCYPFDDGRTSTGTNAYRMIGVAVDPRVIPYKTLIKIPEVGYRIVDDTGAAMRRSSRRGVYHVDVRMKKHRFAIRWGVKRLDIVLYKKVK